MIDRERLAVAGGKISAFLLGMSLVGALLVVSRRSSSSVSNATFPRRHLQDRPVMTTYAPSHAPTDMTAEADAALLHVWKSAWYDSGWQPRILTLDDAKKHPDFDALVGLVDEEIVGPHNMDCYIRWIAMAANDGGWMAEYDTLPMNAFLRHGRDLPNGGVLTLYDGSVPDLVSGTAHEYFRIARRIGESLNRHVHSIKRHSGRSTQEGHQNNTQWSETAALQQLLEHHPDLFKSRQDVLHGENALTGTVWTEEDCEMGRGKRAMHLSYRAMLEGQSPYRGSIHRPTVATQWLNMWRRNCAGTDVEG